MESVLNVNKLDNILAGDNSLTWLWNRNKLHIPCCISTPLSHDTRSCDHQKQWMRNLMYCQTLCCTVIMKVLFFNRFFLLEYQGKWERNNGVIFYTLILIINIHLSCNLILLIVFHAIFYSMPVCIKYFLNESRFK